MTEDKKAIKKSTKYKNKVRFNLNNEKESDSESIYCDMFESDHLLFDEIKFKSNNNEQKTKSCNLPTANESDDSILKVYLENQVVKSFKYDQNTCVKDVLNCLKDKLCINYINFYGLVLKLNNHNCVSSFIVLEETRQLCKLKEQYGNDLNYLCMFRFLFVPSNYQFIISNDEISFNYLYEQSCNDVLNERYGNEIKYEIILHLATLSILHDNINNFPLTDLKNLK